MSELLRVEQVSAGYGEAVVLNDISFVLAEGETLALLGRNGTGKTTLMDTLAGATRQHGGQIFLAGKTLHRWLLFSALKLALGGCLKSGAFLSRSLCMKT